MCDVQMHRKFDPHRLSTVKQAAGVAVNAAAAAVSQSEPCSLPHHLMVAALCELHVGVATVCMRVHEGACWPKDLTAQPSPALL
jgi:hypothetical protein